MQKFFHHLLTILLKLNLQVFFASVNFSLTYLFIFPRLLKASERYKKALEQVFIIILCGTKYIYIYIYIYMLQVKFIFR